MNEFDLTFSIKKLWDGQLLLSTFYNSKHYKCFIPNLKVVSMSLQFRMTECNWDKCNICHPPNLIKNE